MRRLYPSFCVIFALVILAGCAHPSGPLAPPRELTVTANFPGGSALVEAIDQEQGLIRIVPTPQPERGWECWWYFKVEGIRPGQTITLDVGKGVWATPDQAVFSLDNRGWIQTAPGTRQKDRIVFQQQVNASTAWFAWGPPFVLRDAQELVRQMARSPHAQAFTLATSHEGRPVPALRISQRGVPDAERLGIWVQARQHAWESGASWVGKGFIEWLLSNDPRAEALRQRALIHFVPIMDVDNVERGAGGKNQQPHDHNRDWSAEPHWPEVAAAMAQISKLAAAGTFDVFVDLHNPAPRDRGPFFMVMPRNLLSEIGATNLDLFLESAREEINGPMPLLTKLTETGQKYDQNWEKISKNWVGRNTREHVVALTLETGWNTPASTADNYQTVGRQLGLAIERYLRSAQRPGAAVATSAQP